MISQEFYNENNAVYLCGIVNSEPTYSHEFYGEKFYDFFLKVPRLSEYCDILPITVSERIMNEVNLQIGETIALDGQLRSFNKLVEDHSHLMLTVFVKNFKTPVKGNPNIIELKGYICKQPIYRTTPYNREICDLLIAVNRAYNKSDYIPCIAWGRNARFLKDANIGQKINLSGRVQSREYNKRIGENDFVKKTAYEISINKVLFENSTNIDEQ